MSKRPNGQNRKQRPAPPVSALALDATHAQAHERATNASDALAPVSAPAQQRRAAAPSTGAVARGWRFLRAWATGRDWTPWLLLAIALEALGLRLYGINWDANNHLHPDEREIVFRAMCLNFPGQPRTGGCDPAYNGPNWFFSPNSPLNPHFFAYGSFPLYLLAGVAHALAWLTHATHGAFHPSDGGVFDDFNHFTLIGRTLSALFDTGSVIFAGLIARRLAGRWAGLLAAALVAVIPFEVQVSHFYAVDTPTLFFILVTLWACVALARHATDHPAATLTSRKLIARDSMRLWLYGLLAGAALALAVASKVSAAPLLAPMALACVYIWRRRGAEAAILAGSGMIAAAIVAFVVTSPYALIDWKEFIAQISEQTQLSQGKLDYPYVRQFAGTTPYIYQLQQMLLYDVGIPLAALGLAGLGWALSCIWRRWDDDWGLLLVWIIPYFAIIGDAYTKFTRYMLPVFAPLAICGAGALAALVGWSLARLNAPDGPRGLFASRPARWLTALWGTQWARGACVALGLAILLATT
ncbi:MAG: phospholipid carrier-dependent glycosyltransferase, partial [Ktedonobacterales bacterium]